MRCVLLSFIKFFARPIFTKTPHGERNSPSILKIKLSIDRYDGKVPLHHLHEKKQRQLRLQRTCFSNREKKEKPRNKLLFGQNYRPFPWKLVHAVRKDGEKAIWRVKFWSGRPINFRGESRILVWPGREREGERAGRQAGSRRPFCSVASGCNLVQCPLSLSFLPLLRPPSFLSLSPSVFIPSGGREAWAVDNVIYTGRVINVLGDRRFKKTIGNRRQRRATVRPPVSWPPLRWQIINPEIFLFLFIY